MDATRPGFARADALVLLVMLALTAGVAVPAIAKAKKLSDREQCQNNLKKLGAATLAYAADHNGRLPGSNGILLQMLPYTEHSKLAEQLAASGKPWHDPANAKVVATHLALAECPATPRPDRLIEGKVGDDAFKAAPTDYTGVPTITLAVRDLFPDGHDLSSALGLRSRGTLSEISDGYSTTLMGLVEIADKPNHWQAGKLVAKGEARNGSGTWVNNGFNAPRGYTKDGMSFPGPCAMNASNRAAVYSFHPEGCNFLFADGSVRFLSKDLDVFVFYATVTRRGGELLTDSDF
jgi:prepilin-type processing-associated H-X9-DG protein